jgi:NAD(P)-dependent dehydrogenase (short-subunit alcohol dehydrogenase family)
LVQEAVDRLRHLGLGLDAAFRPDVPVAQARRLRMGEVSEIVDAILYLERTKFVTGETLNVDGGQHAGRW